jgi:hypothetical protein
LPSLEDIPEEDIPEEDMPPEETSPVAGPSTMLGEFSKIEPQNP